jgi:glycosyltransferase involved in cell wall biosynthesis
MTVHKNKGKLTFLIASLGGGGAERVCVILANGLFRCGWQVDVVVLNRVDNDRVRSLDSGVKLVCLDVVRARYAHLVINRYCKQNQPDIVVSMSNELAFSEYVNKLLFGRKYSYIIRNVNTLSAFNYHDGGGLLSSLKFFLLKYVFRSADRIVCQCKEMERDMFRVTNVSQSSSQVIYNPVSLDLDYEDKEQSRGASILCVGRLDKNKDFALAITALACLAKKGVNVDLWIVGAGPERINLEKLAAELAVLENIKFLGFQVDLTPIYKQVSCVSLTSNYEGFPNVLLEAISHGVPVVSVDCPCGPREIVENDMNGYLVKGRAPQDLALAFEKALTKDWDRQVILKSAERFAEDKILKQWDELLTEILGGRVAK